MKTRSKSIFILVISISLLICVADSFAGPKRGKGKRPTFGRPVPFSEAKKANRLKLLQQIKDFFRLVNLNRAEGDARDLGVIINFYLSRLPDKKELDSDLDWLIGGIINVLRTADLGEDNILLVKLHMLIRSVSRIDFAYFLYQDLLEAEGNILALNHDTVSAVLNAAQRELSRRAEMVGDEEPPRDHRLENIIEDVFLVAEENKIIDRTICCEYVRILYLHILDSKDDREEMARLYGLMRQIMLTVRSFDLAAGTVPYNYYLLASCLVGCDEVECASIEYDLDNRANVIGWSRVENMDPVQLCGYVQAANEEAGDLDHPNMQSEVRNFYSRIMNKFISKYRFTAEQLIIFLRNFLFAIDTSRENIDPRNFHCSCIQGLIDDLLSKK